MSDEKTASPAPASGGGQAAPAPAPTGQAPGAGEFYGWTHPDGKREAFASKEDLDKAFKESYFRRQDYTTKTQSLADFRKAVEQEKTDLKKQREEMEGRLKKYETYEWMYNNRPDIRNKFEQIVSSTPSPDAALGEARSYADQQIAALREQMEQMQTDLKEQQLQRQKAELYARMGKELPDFRPDVVDELFDVIGGGDLEALVRVLNHAAIGRDGPLQAEKRLAEAQKEKGNIKIMPSKGSTPASKTIPKTLEEAEQKALESLRGG